MVGVVTTQTRRRPALPAVDPIGCTLVIPEWKRCVTVVASGQVDVAVIGGGIVGLATARELLARRPGLQVMVLEKEPEVASHQTGHNSGVLHAGLYYTPGSLKARLTREGKAAMEQFATEHGIEFETCGKIVVALDETELDRFEALRERAEANGIPGLEVLGPDGLRAIEPHALGIRALWSPGTGVIDYRRVALAMAGDVRAAGGDIQSGRPVTAVERRADEVVLSTPAGEVVARRVIACAGLHADRVARMGGEEPTEHIIPFRGDYYTLTPDARHLVRSLLYPVPDPRFPFLGVHLSRTVRGEVIAGPNAVLAFAREGYGRWQINPKDLAEVLRDRRFHKLARKFWRTGAAEMWRDWSKRAYLKELQRYVPELRAEHLVFGPSGVRAQAVDPDGSMVDDFRLGGDDRILHVRNAPSPAATASLAIGRMLADTAEERFALAS